MDTMPAPTVAEVRLQAAASVALALIAALAVYAWLACTGHVPATPWSPIGQVQQHDTHTQDGTVVGLPQGLSLDDLTPAPVQPQSPAVQAPAQVTGMAA